MNATNGVGEAVPKGLRKKRFRNSGFRKGSREKGLGRRSRGEVSGEPVVLLAAPGAGGAPPSWVTPCAGTDLDGVVCVPGEFRPVARV